MGDARRFQGTYSYKSDTDEIILTAKSPEEERIEDGGPGIGWSGSWQEQFSFSAERPDSLLNDGDTFSALRTVEAQQAARVDVYRRAGEIDAAMAPGRIYEGTITIKGQSTTVVLRFLENEKAVIECARYENRARTFDTGGRRNRYTEGNWDIGIVSGSENRGDSRAADAIAYDEDRIAIGLTLQGSKLAGKNGKFEAAFTARDQSWYEAFARNRRANFEQALDLVSTGNIYRVTASPKGESKSVDFTFTVTESAGNGATVALRMEMVSDPSINGIINGTFDPISGWFIQKPGKSGRADVVMNLKDFALTGKLSDLVLRVIERVKPTT